MHKEVELPRLYIMISLIEQNLVMTILVVYVKKYGKNLIITLSLINLKTEILMVNYELLGIGEFCSLKIFVIKPMTECLSKYMIKYKYKSKSKSQSMSKYKYKSTTKSKPTSKYKYKSKSKSIFMIMTKSISNVKQNSTHHH